MTTAEKGLFLRRIGLLMQHWVPSAQRRALRELLRGEERQWFAHTLGHLADRVDAMPKVYEQDGKGDEAVAYVHYFSPSWDWYVTERDISDEQQQAFGLVFGHEVEAGYISIQDLLYTGRVELDLHFEPKTLREIRAQKGA